jgi:hypothetical protein
VSGTVYGIEGLKKQLNTLLLSFNLFSILDFPTKSYNNSISLIDNIFIDHFQSGKYLVHPMISGLSDHDAQLLIIKTICLQTYKYKISTTRIFNDQSLLNFKIKLSYETWDDVFSGNDVDIIFNSFLNTYLRMFYSCFPLKKITSSKTKINNWISPGIKISCRRRRELFWLYRNSNDANCKSYYKLYCRILSSVISTAERLHYDGLIMNLKNKMKTTWNIVKSVTGKRSEKKPFQLVHTNGTLTENQQVIADSFQNHFLSVADKTISTINNNPDIKDNNFIDYLFRVFINTFPNIIFDHTMTKEIEKIIKSLKSKDSYGYDEIPIEITHSLMELSPA